MEHEDVDSPPHSPTQSQNDSDDPFSSQPKRRKPHSTSRHDLPSDTEPEDPLHSRKEKIPEALLSVLLQQFFKQEGTRMSKSASAAVGNYMDTFVREGLARAAWAGDTMDRDGGMGGGGILEVEDLERLGPQLLMDF
jgi:CENP-S associating Centromere protein X